ncbi:alpha-2-macroglobulin family protein [Candidatus Albibeggiatoa sp. nov. NOAA]|uniref:alpha-2-macroglobulin family protein n=1 Tax=Candidatus Albibeggiatoa sp. nov. NOAA TaxID=3162724 RepID=UPI0032F44685|nr:MG2 domain-containing protein [Thiotrichaceae bacterium]
MILRITFLLLLLLYLPVQAAYDSAAFNQDKPFKLSRVTPKGKDVYPARQIVFTFNQPVVALGKMERDAAEIPITISPELNCQWRWINTSSLACELNEKDKLAYATRYRVLVQPKFVTTAGKKLIKTYSHQFITQRPKVNYSYFNTWRAPGMPELQVTFNQPVSKESVEKHLYMKKPNGRRVAVKAKLPTNVKAPKDFAQTWIVYPKRLLPLDSKITLNVERGLVSNLGPERGIQNEVETSFHTFPEFKFLGIECDDLQDNSIKLGASEKWTKRCNPLRRIGLRFSSPVIAEVVKQNLLIMPDLAGGRKDYDPWENTSSYSRLGESNYKNKTYTLWLPEYLKAYELYQLKSMGTATFRDEFGRPLKNPIDLAFATDHRAPMHYMQYQYSVLEQGVDSELPIFVTNLDKVNIKYHTLGKQGWSSLLNAELDYPKIQDVAIKTPFNVRKLLNSKSGVVQGYYHTTPKTDDHEESRWFFSQVTPYQLQVKLGHHNTLVWVTEFATGKPVANATVNVFAGNYQPQSEPYKTLATATTNEHGIAMLAGTSELDPKLEKVGVYSRDKKRFFVQVEHGEETALLPLDYEYQISMYDLNVDYTLYPYMRKKYGHIHTWGTTAQGIYKVGDTVQYKILVRDQDNQRFIPAPAEKYTLKVEDPMGKTVHEVKDVKLNQFGSLHGEFTIPKTGAVGWYGFNLKADFTKDNWQPMRVLVSDFTPAPFRVTTEIQGKLFKQGDTVKVDTLAKLHAGGAYGNAETRVTAILKPRSLRPSHPVAKGFWFDVSSDKDYDSTIFQTTGKVDDKGEMLTEFTLQNSPILYGQLTLESAVKDDRGKNVANSSTAKYVGRDRFVGTKQESWLATAKQDNQIQLLVVNEFGRPTTGTAINVKIEREEVKASRVKGAGNAYLTKYERSWVDAGTCQQTDLMSDIEPLTCTFKPEKVGDYRLTATIQDSEGLSHSTTEEIWVVGSGMAMWAMPKGNGLHIMPEQQNYKVGETAKYLVKNPYPEAQALITVERYGVLDSWGQVITNSMEVIEIPIKPDYVPGFFVSVTLFSPRVDKPLGDGKVDLGKPTYRMGYVKTMVNEPYKKLVVDIKTDKQTYRPREQVSIDLQAKPLNGELQQPIELAVAVLDESVFDLVQGGKAYFDPYEGFYNLDDLDMANFSLLTRLIGRQKFEKKGANAGGDGGMGLSMRSVFKYISYWNPSIPVDKDGKAQIQFNVPDNLTGWRVLAIAVTPEDKMGLSDANFKVNQPIELRPIMPNQVLEGDSFHAGFSVMNRTEKTRQLSVDIQATGMIADGKQAFTQTVTAEPYQRYKLWMPLETKDDGHVHFIATAKDDEEQDGLEHRLKIHPRRAMDSQATYGTTIANKITEQVAIPQDIYPDVGGLSVTLSPTVIGGVSGAFDYMQNYPYACWEQKLTKGVMASHFNQLRDYISDVSWDGSDTLPQSTLQLATDFQASNGGMTYFIPTDNRVSPYLSAYTALAFNWMREQGLAVNEKVENKLHDYLSRLLRKNIAPEHYSAGMSSTVRAVALAALAKQQKVTREDIKRYRPHVDKMSLFGQAMYLQAAVQIPRTQRIQTEVVDKILSHANQTSGRVSFVEDLDSNYKRLLSSPLRTECVILSSLLQYDEASKGKTEVGDMPFKLVRQITKARQQKGHWENTQENMFCMNALIDYARIYEKEVVDMAITSFLDTEQLGYIEFDDVQNPAETFVHPMTSADVGREAVVKLQKQGTGRMYYNLRLQYATLDEKAEAVNAGMSVQREYHVERDGEWVLLQSPMQIQAGELVRVDLYLSLPAARYYVAVNDPVPGGLEPVNRDLATASTVDADKAGGQYAGGSLWFTRNDWSGYNMSFWSFYHKELRHHAAIFYADYLSAGNYHLSYTAQAIAAGEFSVMSTHAEEMYEPEIYGKSKPAKLVVTRD